MQNRWTKQPMLAIVNNHLVDYPTPINISYYWGFGSLAGICLVIQIVTGIFLAMHYTPHVDLAFTSVEHIMRDVNNGWLLRYLHANGASFFFIMVYAHMFRGLYYGSYAHPREHLWCSGVTIIILMMATGFIGYVLPWGQMSFWGATVITNLISAVPAVGTPIVEWVWGGFSVDNPTLNRFFSLHYILPFVIAGLVLVHLALLHENGSNNPLGVDSKVDRVPFYPYFYVKDLFGLVLMLLVFSVFVFFYPNTLGHPDNYIPANPMLTPAHIVPEWYFLPFYAILRSIPHKLGGVVAMLGALISLMALPYLNTSEVRSSAFRPIFRQLFWLFLVDCLILGWIGQNVVEYPYVEIGQIATFYYFFFLLVLIPGLGRFESYLMRMKVLLSY
jgi:ubiquinol-cytochrome c reductase cytochrome b subunit